MSDDKPRESAPDKTISENDDTMVVSVVSDPVLEDDTLPNTLDFDAIGAAAELDHILSAVEPGDSVEQRGESYTEILESEVAELSALLEARDTELAAVKDELAAARDELDRSLGRVEREYERQAEQGTRKMLLEFLDVLDDLDRALASAEGMDHNPAVLDGVELVRKGFMLKLVRAGVTHDPSMGEVFDPNLHDAMSVTPVTDATQNNTVVAVIREGYKLGDTVLRPAGVVVGKYNG